MVRILLVEDNEMNRDMLKRRLVRKGFDVLLAVNGAEGIELAARHRPDLVLLDIGLPDQNGWEVTEHLKSSSDTQAIPILALTAHATAADRQKSFDAGCDDFETKPVRFQMLLEKIKNLL